ncbi:hypothetical protein [Adhaeribacter aerolatus]|nr:hypothetical protein [Adhaeribacter aerolatus]
MDTDTIKGSANHQGHAGNLGDDVPNETDNVLRMGAAALTGMGAQSQVADMSSGGDSFQAIGGSEGYTGDDTSGGGADPYGDENPDAGSGTGSDVGTGADRAGGGTGNDLAGEEGYDREADGAGMGAGGLRRGDSNRPDTSASPGGLGSDD